MIEIHNDVWMEADAQCLTQVIYNGDQHVAYVDHDKTICVRVNIGNCFCERVLL